MMMMMMMKQKDQKYIAIFWLRRIDAAIATRFAIFLRKKRPHSGLAGDGDVCDKMTRRFAIAIFGALRTGEIAAQNQLTTVFLMFQVIPCLLRSCSGNNFRADTTNDNTNVWELIV